MIYLFLWWLIGLISFVCIYAFEQQKGKDITLKELLLILIWSLAGLFVPGIVLYTYGRNRNWWSNILSVFDKTVIKGRRK